jgi:hypothetical protein
VALTEQQAAELIALIADALPTGQEGYSADGWVLRTLVRSRLAQADVATFDSLVASAEASSVPRSSLGP